MKKFMAIAMAAVLLVCSLASCATNLGDPDAIEEYTPEVTYLITEQGTFHFDLADGNTAVLVKYNGNATKDDHVEIPPVFGTRTVTEIGDEAFYNLAAVVEVTIPDTVIRIGKYAFAGCTELTSINLPAGTLQIDDCAFANCTALTTVNDADHPLSALTTISRDAFWGCTALTTINGGKLPATLTTIGPAAFLGCTALPSLEIPESVTSIGDLAFYNCTGLESIKLHDKFPENGLGQFIFSTEKGNLKDKIDTSNLAEGTHAWNYVQNIADIEQDGDSETAADTAAETDAATDPVA